MTDETIYELKGFIEQAVSPFHTIQAVKERLLASGFEELGIADDFKLAPAGKYLIDIYDSSMLAFTVGEDFTNISENREVVSKNRETVSENREAVSANREAVSENREAVSENREVVSANREAVSENREKISEGREGIKNASNSRNGKLRFTSSHTDFPGFKIKPNAVIFSENSSGSGYVKVNTEVYGGPILNTWLDRTLSVAGRIVVKGDGVFHERSICIDAKNPVMIIPNLAIHMNREVNKGVELNRQKDMLPIVAFTENMDKSDTDIINILFRNVINELSIAREDIIDYELYVYNTEKGETVGINAEMYSSPRLDNLTSVFAQTKAIINSRRADGLNVALYFDNEEIGSRTKQGAASSVVMLLLEKIYAGLGLDRNMMINDILSGMMISVDVAHAIHPNAPEKSDPTNQVMLNRGIVIKTSAAQSYSNDAIGTSVIKRMCEANDIDCQVFVNKSDMQGGQTLGAISSTVVPTRTIDIGIPLLAMHSSRELMGIKDEKNLEKFLTVYYS